MLHREYGVDDGDCLNDVRNEKLMKKFFGCFLDIEAMSATELVDFSNSRQLFKG